MKFSLTIEKKYEASIDDKMCINCGKCSEICPVDAIEECRRQICSVFPSGGSGIEISGMPASSACPAGVIPQAAAAMIKYGDLKGACRYIAEKNPMPSVCSEVCHQPCRDMCSLAAAGYEPLNMRALENYAFTYADADLPAHRVSHDEKIAVIGSGPAGLTAAYDLSAAGYAVTVFEKDRYPGGALSWKLPEFTLGRKKLSDDIDRILDAGNISIRYRQELGRTLNLDDIWKEGFSICLIAAGRSYAIQTPLPGSDADIVCDAVDFMRYVNGHDTAPMKIGDRVTVIGDGSLAADTARTLRCMDKEVILASINSPDSMQISDSVITSMEKEGVEIRTLAGPVRIISEDGAVRAVEFMEVEHIRTRGGVMAPHGIRDSEFRVECDSVIFAVGTRCDVSGIEGLETDEEGLVKTDGDSRTNLEKVFACGEAVTECASAIDAVRSGRDAARCIIRQLGGRTVQEENDGVCTGDTEMIYLEELREHIPQYEGYADPDEDITKDGTIYAEDMAAVLKAAGITGDMGHFGPEDENGIPKKKVAVIGGGIAGMAAAAELAARGRYPCIFEREPSLGGEYRWLSSYKRADRKILERGLEIFSASGIPAVCGTFAGGGPGPEDLMELGFEAVLFTPGRTAGVRPDVRCCRGVQDVVSVMAGLMNNEKMPDKGRQIIITGSDELVFDTARMLKDDDCHVTVMTPSGRGHLGAGVRAVEAALDEGINLVTGVEITGISADEGRLSGIRCRMTAKDIEADIPCDTLITGAVRKPDIAAAADAVPEISIGEDGCMEVDAALMTGKKGVFYADSTVMGAAEAGLAGAASVDRYLEGLEPEDIILPEPEEDPAVHQIFEGRKSTEQTPGTRRRPFTEWQAGAEASRCPASGYRREIASRCIGCGLCADICPVNAVVMKKAEEV